MVGVTFDSDEFAILNRIHHGTGVRTVMRATTVKTLHIFHCLVHRFLLASYRFVLVVSWLQSQACKWKTLFMIFHSPFIFNRLKQSVNRWPVQLSISKRAVATVPTISILVMRYMRSLAGPFWSFQS